MIESAVPNKLSILVVDDEEMVRSFLETAISSKGHRVLTASDGQQAERMAARHEFDVVLLDLVMPGPSGTETLQHLLKARPGLVVIMLTGYGSLDSAREAMRLGAYDYLTKPIDPVFLNEVIADNLHLKQEMAFSVEQ